MRVFSGAKMELSYNSVFGKLLVGYIKIQRIQDFYLAVYFNCLCVLTENISNASWSHKSTIKPGSSLFLMEKNK